jgi:hypothetical protein
MKTKLLLTFAMAIGISSMSVAQFTTGTVTLAGSTRTLKINTSATTVTMTLTAPSNVWFGVGFGGFSMAETTDVFIWSSSANRDYQAPGGHFTPSPDAAAAQSWSISSDVIASGVRTVVATRALVSAGDYTFVNDNSPINIIYAEGSSTALAGHGTSPHDVTTLTRTVLGAEDFSLKASAIFPNPSNGIFTVQSKTNLDKINVYTQTGSFVKTITVDSTSNSTEVNLKDLQSGIYMIELQNQSEKSWKKIIIN